MKTRSIIFYFALAVGFLGSQTVLAQTTPTTDQNLNLTVSGSAMLNMTGGDVALSLSGLTTAGAAISLVAQDSTSRLKISALPTTGNTFTITAAITGNDLTGSQTTLQIQLLAPTGANLTAFANYATGGGGTLAGSLQDISNNAGSTVISLVTGITTCWSGTDADNGYQVKYKYMYSGVGTPINKAVTVTYTITEV